MKYRSCVVVFLIGTEPASRQWVKYEIIKAWTEGKGLLGIYIHNIRDPRTDTCHQGSNPFQQCTLNGQNFGDIATCHNPSVLDTYNDIRNNLDKWVEDAIRLRNCYQK